MSHHHQGGAGLLGDRDQLLHDFVAGRLVESARRLIGKNDCRFSRDSSSDGDALSLAAGHFSWSTVDQLPEPQALQHVSGVGISSLTRRALKNCRESHVFLGRELGKELPVLEHKPEFAQPER